MKISLYKFNGERVIANKIKGLSPVYSGDITPYGEFDANRVFFRLHKMLNVNVCKYTYNGHDYYGSVTVSVDSKGLYVYEITNDPLSTAWYNDCMNTSAVCEYSTVPTNELFDNRATYSSSPIYSRHLIQGYTSNYNVVMVTVAAENFIPSISPAILYTNPGVKVYLFSAAQYFQFLISFMSLNAKVQTALAAGIIKIYAVPVIDTPTLSDCPTPEIYLDRVNGSSIGALLSDDLTQNNINAGYSIPTINHPKLINYTDTTHPYTSFSTGISDFGLTSWRRRSQITLHIADVGEMTFTYDDVCENSSITSIGFNRYIEFTSGVQKCVLTVNGKEKENFFIMANCPETIPFIYDNSVVDWRNATASAASAAISLIGSIGAIATAGPTGGLSLTALPGLLAGAATSGIQVGTEMSRNKENEKSGSFGTLSGLGGSFNRVERKGSYIVIRENMPINLTNIQNKFGKVDGKSHTISNLTGYVKTLNCRLKQNGLPEGIIRDAEQACDGGFVISS